MADEAAAMTSTRQDGDTATLDLILDVPLAVSVELGRVRMAVRELLALGAGSVIELAKLAGEPLDVLINGKPVARLEPAVAKPTSGKAREKAIARMVELMEKGLDFGGRRFTRNELNER